MHLLTLSGNPKFKWNNLWDDITGKLRNEPSGHGIEHIHAVEHYAAILATAETEGVNIDVLKASAWLHDISAGRGYERYHHERSAGDSEELLFRHNFPSSMYDPVMHAIINHKRDYSENVPDTDEELSVEAKLLCDADRLDSFGARGIMRVLRLSTQKGLPTFVSPKDGLNESAYGNLKHLFTLRSSMFTDKGFELANEGVVVVEQYLHAMEQFYINGTNHS